MTRGNIDPVMDLNKGFPRSPRAMLGGMIWLPRLIDKARAKLAGALGEYSYNCPMDVRFFQFAGLDAETFLKAAADSSNDEAVLAWIRTNARPATAEEIARFNAMLVGLGPDAPDEKTGLKTWCDLIDRDEGRI